MPISHRSPKVLLRPLLSLPAIFALSIPLLLTACGGKASSTPGSTSGSTPTPGSAKPWTWMSGSNTANATGVYGTRGVASASNIPGARDSAVSWIDHSGNLWLFGGEVNLSGGGGGTFNDLWEFNPSASTWTWVGGSNAESTSGVYGSQGVASTSNIPGARYSATSVTDSSGNFWLFGGCGIDSVNMSGSLNDLWEFNPSTKAWTWVGGSKFQGAVGVYGAQGVSSVSNVPGNRLGASSWADGSGNIWLFGGYGIDSTGAYGNLNDLWEFTPSTKAWTWVGGSNTVGAKGGQPGIYGTQGVASVNNVPGARQWATSWTDHNGNLWLFGGGGYDSTDKQVFLNDLWEFNPSAKTWTWISGANTGGTAGGQSGTYGTMGVAAASNVPGGRYLTVNWIDSSGNLWLFGGFGIGATYPPVGVFNDLWEFNPTSKEWTWMSGSNAENALGVYGTMGTTATGNVPGGRRGAVSWIDSSGNFWLFGGDIYIGNGANGDLNDLWRYQP